MRVAIVGAGLSGITAARELDGHEVVVVDKASTVGGRLATTRIGDAVFDTGAQFFTIRGEAFRSQVEDWIVRGLVRVWCHGFPGREDGYPRYVGTNGMGPLTRDLATGVEVQLGRMAFTMHRTSDGWRVVFDDASSIDADAVVLTCPLAQSWALLAQAGDPLPDELLRSEYHRTIALLVTLDGSSSIEEPGGLQFDPADPDAPFGFVADNHRKGISSVPALTLHATQPWSVDHWIDSDQLIAKDLLERAAPFIGNSEVVDATVKRWRFAGPVSASSETCWSDPDSRVVLAGDAFAGAKVEGAFDSGLAAAAAVRVWT